MTYAGATTTYAALTSRVARLANVLDGIGISGGSRVAYLGANHPAFPESLFATATLGAIFVPLNARLSATEIDFVLGDSGADVLFFGGASASTVDQLEVATRPRLIAVDSHTEGALDYEAMIAGASDAPIDAKISLDDPCLIMYTSGTTGRPKGRSSVTTTSLGTASTSSSTSTSAATR
jgi:fatty-acyl-CoA synthase